LSGAAVAAALVPMALAQGPLYRESWAYLHLERLRAAVAAELPAGDAANDAAKRAEIARLMLADDGGIPFRGPAAALAKLRSVECDDAFLYRAMVSAFVLPEVADPDGSKTDCRDVAVSVFLPYTIPEPGAVTFAVQLVDAAGKERFAAVIDRDTGMADVRMGRASATLPCRDLPDGTYEVRVQARFADRGPRPGDPTLRTTVLVQRGWQARAENALAKAGTVAAELAEPPKSLLLGCAAEVQRAYTGQPWAVAPSAVDDLTRLEAVLDNLANKRPLLAGLSGPFTGMLLVGNAGQGTAARSPEARQEQRLGVSLNLPADAAPRPWLIVAAGAPTYDAACLRRPAAPTSRHSLWTLADAAGLPPRCLVVALESPGNGVNYGQALERVIAAVPQIAAVAGKPLLIGEREAALAACFQLPALAAQLRGLVLVAGGAMSPQALPNLGGLPVLALPLAGHQGSDGLRLLRDLAAGKHGTLQVDAKLRVAKDSGLPWPMALRLAVPQMAGFVADLIDK
jgi:hypothetical protein